MERQDLRSVLRLFAEIASSMNPEEGSRAPDDVGAGRELLPETGGESWVPSTTR
jgi:hypothetical protein